MFYSCNCHAVGVNNEGQGYIKELSNLGFKAFAISAGDKEVFAEDDSPVSESFGVCCTCS